MVALPAGSFNMGVSTHRILLSLDRESECFSDGFSCRGPDAERPPSAKSGPALMKSLNDRIGAALPVACGANRSCRALLSAVGCRDPDRQTCFR